MDDDYLINTRTWEPEKLDPDKVKMLYGNLKYRVLKMLVEYGEGFSVSKVVELFSNKMEVANVSRYTKTKMVRALKELVAIGLLDVTSNSHKLIHRRYCVNSAGKQYIKIKEERFQELSYLAQEFFDTSELIGDFKIVINQYNDEEGIRVRYGLKGIMKGFSIVLYFKEFTDQKRNHHFYTDLYTRELLNVSRFFGMLRSTNSKIPRTDWKVEEIEMFMIALRQYGKFPHPERYKSVNDINREILKSYCVFRHGVSQTIDIQEYEVPLLVSEFSLIRVLSKSVFKQDKIEA